MNDELYEALSNGELPLIEPCDDHPDASLRVEETHPLGRPDPVRCDECGAVTDAM